MWKVVAQLSRSAVLAVVVLSATLTTGCNEPKVFEGGVGGTSGAVGSGGNAAPITGGSGGINPNVGGGSGEGGLGGPSQGGSAACVPKAEDCFDGVDDDCDLKTDCEDPDCTATAMCTESGGPDGLALILDGDQACPKEFAWAQESSIFQGLTAENTCGGCSCQASDITCVPELYAYEISQAECEADTAGSGGGLVTFAKPLRFRQQPPDPSECERIQTGGAGLSLYGLRLASLKPSAKCTPAGTATVAPPRWAKRAALCTPTRIGSGCGGGACVPRITGAKLGVRPSNGTCSSAYPNRDIWHKGLTDSRVCGQCSCGMSGGQCGNVAVTSGADYGCSGLFTVRVDLPKSCGAGYSPAAALSGEPTPPTCSPTSAFSGAALPADPVTLCTR